MNMFFKGSAICLVMANAAFAVTQDDDLRGGPIQLLESSFNYQGQLIYDGEPANGDFYFEIHLLDSNGDEIDPLFDTPGPIPVVNGLFDMNILMGGDSAGGNYFWKKYGPLAKKMRISVGLSEGSVNTVLSPDIELGSSPHALFSRYAGGLYFPYSETYTNEFSDPETMLSLRNVFGGTTLLLKENTNTNYPVLLVEGATTMGPDFGTQNGVLRVDSSSDSIGVLSFANQYPIAGILTNLTPSPGAAAVLAQVFSGVTGSAFRAINNTSGNNATLGSAQYAGQFTGDVLAQDNLRVQDELVRDFAPNDPSPAGPLAYGTINSGGTLSGATGNLNSSWDSVNFQYILTVDNESLVLGLYVAVVTVVDSFEPRVATINMTSGSLKVKIWDINSGNIAVQDNFQVVIYKPGFDVVTQSRLPDGTDLDQYAEQTGSIPTTSMRTLKPIETQPDVGIGKK